MRIFFGCLALLIALFLATGCAAGIALTLFLATVEEEVQQDIAPPVVPVVPPKQPDCPDCKPKQPDNKNKNKRHWAAEEYQPVGLMDAGASRGSRDGPTHNGQDVQIDIPADLLKRNIASKGLGCCVFRATEYVGLANNVPSVVGVPEKMKADGVAGGGWPEKYDEIYQRYAPDYKYVQVQNGDWDILKIALKSGRAVAVTVMGGSHMVTLVKLENGMAAFRDNNYTGPNEIWWMTEEEAKQETACRYTGNKFWAVIPLNGRPPAPPRSRGAAAIAPRLVVALSPELLPGKYRWGNPIGGDQWPLFRDDVQVGAFVPAWNSYRERLGHRQWGETWRRPPVPLPEDALKALEQSPGVAAERLMSRQGYFLCGQQVSRDEAMAAIEDDSAKPSLTAIGAKEETARVRADLGRPENAQLKSHVVFQEYKPTDWAVSTQRYGFDTSGKPTVYLQNPDGTVLWHTNQYDGSTMTNLRKNDPGYKPESDPGMPKAPAPAHGSGFSALHIGVCLIGLGIFVFAMLSLGLVGLWQLGSLLIDFFA